MDPDSFLELSRRLAIQCREQGVRRVRATFADLQLEIEMAYVNAPEVASAARHPVLDNAPPPRGGDWLDAFGNALPVKYDPTRR